MKLTLVSEDAIRYEAAPGMLTVEADSAERQFSPFHMLGGSLAVCTFSVLASWATHAKIPFEDLVIDVTWTFAEQPHRIGTMTLAFDWKSLPASRLEAAKRAAALCPVHTTLHHTTDVRIAGKAGNADAPAAPSAPAPTPAPTPAATPAAAPTTGAGSTA